MVKHIKIFLLDVLIKISIFATFLAIICLCFHILVEFVVEFMIYMSYTYGLYFGYFHPSMVFAKLMASSYMQ